MCLRQQLQHHIVSRPSPGLGRSPCLSSPHAFIPSYGPRVTRPNTFFLSSTHQLVFFLRQCGASRRNHRLSSALPSRSLKTPIAKDDHLTTSPLSTLPSQPSSPRTHSLFHPTSLHVAAQVTTYNSTPRACSTDTFHPFPTHSLPRVRIEQSHLKPPSPHLKRSHNQTVQ